MVRKTKKAPDFETITQPIAGLIEARMERDHLDMAHKRPDEPTIVVGHFERTAQAIIYTQVEQYLDSSEGFERDMARRMMVDRYHKAAEISRKYGLGHEFRSVARLDQAAAVARDYLQSINGNSDIPQNISYKTVTSHKRISGQELVEYFMADILKEAYEHVFSQLGIDPDAIARGRRFSI